LHFATITLLFKNSIKAEQTRTKLIFTFFLQIAKMMNEMNITNVATAYAHSLSRIIRNAETASFERLSGQDARPAIAPNCPAGITHTYHA
jgi:hypothetical protein